VQDELDPLSLARRRVLGVGVMVSISLLQLTAEYLGTHDRGRLLSKGLVLLLGLPVVAEVASRGFRLSARKRRNPVPLLVAGAVASGLLFSGLLSCVRTASGVWPLLRPQHALGVVDAARIGFALGVASFGLWALAFVVPFAAEDARIRALEADRLRTLAELAQLRSYLEPHFLLNTLSAVSGLVAEDPREACRLLAALGELLRDARQADDEMQPLHQEIRWLERYAHILEVRHAGQVAFRWEVDGKVRQALLPRLLLQPLVENAVQHGALMRARGGEILVRAELQPGPRLVCTVEDNGPGVPEGAPRQGAFGLLAVRRRLALRYADRASLRLESSSAGTRSVVEVPLQGVEAPS
jgi:signal transduction histidine kinase